jgi:hypothetical protein
VSRAITGKGRAVMSARRASAKREPRIWWRMTGASKADLTLPFLRSF